MHYKEEREFTKTWAIPPCRAAVHTLSTCRMQLQWAALWYTFPRAACYITMPYCSAYLERMHYAASSWYILCSTMLRAILLLAAYTMAVTPCMPRGVARLYMAIATISKSAATAPYAHLAPPPTYQWKRQACASRRCYFTITYVQCIPRARALYS